MEFTLYIGVTRCPVLEVIQGIQRRFRAGVHAA